MTRTDKSKRSFFKKVAAAVGFGSAAGYLQNLISAHTNSIQVINENREKDVIKQKQVWLRKQWVPMTDSDKKQMLEDILDMHNNNQT